MDANRICPILNHPLKDGVLVNDDVLVKFIQKRNVDFLPSELICTWCKNEVIKLYNKKLKKARELRKSRMHDSSVSSFQTSKSSSSSASNASVANGSNITSTSFQKKFESVSNESANNEKNRSHTSKKLVQNGKSTTNLNGSKSLSSGDHNAESPNSSKKIQASVAAKPIDHSVVTSKQKETSRVNIVSVSDTAITLATSISNTHSILQENRNKADTIQEQTTNLDEKNVTVRKKTIKDFLVAKPPPKKVTVVVPTPQVTVSTEKNSSITAGFTRQMRISTDSDSDSSTRRLSQEPTTSRAAATNANKRPISAIIDSEDEDSDDGSEWSGTRLAHIQPHPPKRKPTRNSSSIGQDIMDNYIRDITGG